jgi:transposase
MNGYSEDLRQKVVSALGRGMPKAQAARTFSVSLSSVKRYVEKAERGEPLAPKKSPGSPPKLDEKARASYSKTASESAPLPPFGSAATTWRS